MIKRELLDNFVKEEVPIYFLNKLFVKNPNGSIQFEDENILINLTLNFLERPTFFTPSYVIVIKVKSIEKYVEKFIGRITPGAKESFTFSLNKKALHVLTDTKLQEGLTSISETDDVRKFWNEIELDYKNLLAHLLPDLTDLKKIDKTLNSDYHNFETIGGHYTQRHSLVLKKLVSAKLVKNLRYQEIYEHFVKFIEEKNPQSNLLDILKELDADLKT